MTWTSWNRSLAGCESGAKIHAELAPDAMAEEPAFDSGRLAQSVRALL
jgi:hypothetical protein